MKLKLTLALCALALAGCTTNPPAPMPDLSGFIEQPIPADGATGVSSSPTLSWSYVGVGYIPMPTAVLILNGSQQGTYLGTNAWLVNLAPGAQFDWQVLAKTAAGTITGKVWRFTTAPTNVPPPVVTNLPPPSGGLLRGTLFVAQKQPKQPWITTPASWPDGTHSYARSHGHSWENDYRTWLVKAISQWGGNAITFYPDALYGAIELEMFLCDTAQPIPPGDGHHISDAENSAVWLKKSGVTTHILALTDSPPPWNLPGGSWDKYIADLSRAYATARGIQHVWLIGLECNRNPITDAAGCRNIAATIRKYEPSARIVVGSASLDFLKGVHAADAGLELWKEVDQHPINNPLTMLRRMMAGRPARAADTFDKLLADMTARNTYLSELDQLAALVGPARTWAGEWYAESDATRLEITAQLTARGYQCGSGQWLKPQMRRPGAKYLYGHIKDAPGKLRRLFQLAPRGQNFAPVSSLRNSPHLRAVYNQLEHGSCVWNTTLTVFDFQHHQLTGEFADLSRMFGYRQTMVMENTDPTTDGGCMPADAYQFQMQSGSCRELLWPYTPDNTGLVNTPPQACFDDALTNQALQDRAVPQDLQTLKSVLALQPITMGITVFDGDNGLESDVAAKTGIVGLPSSYNQLRMLGRHGVTLIGWDDSKRIPRPIKGLQWPWTKQTYTVGAFEVRNSWDRTWGDEGNFWLPYEFVLNPDWADSFWTFDKVE